MSFTSPSDFIYDLNQFAVTSSFLFRHVICKTKTEVQTLCINWAPSSTHSAISEVHHLPLKSFISMLSGN